MTVAPNRNFESILGHPFPIDTVRVLRDIADERDRQNVKFPDQVLPDGTGKHNKGLADLARHTCEQAAEGGYLTWRDILVEETYEAFAEDDYDALRKELVQVAAVAARWIEAIDSRVRTQ